MFSKCFLKKKNQRETQQKKLIFADFCQWIAIGKRN
jgi:hypothetical protein